MAINQLIGEKISTLRILKKIEKKDLANKAGLDEHRSTLSFQQVRILIRNILLFLPLLQIRRDVTWNHSSLTLFQMKKMIS